MEWRILAVFLLLTAGLNGPCVLDLFCRIEDVLGDCDEASFVS